ncbi:MAG: hypothetical protein Q8M88_14810 [Phenylobacterium sp.]|uniref:glycosyltransferase n=1 Tax=Phenylobacterium sp. TaxID=1871053 RepID=UPI0027351A51|nr:hypothetical protein [Phenylobacterium sp.]MDP3175701.1 hypothetical protein [Phenylobacterium sp.]
MAQIDDADGLQAPGAQTSGLVRTAKGALVLLFYDGFERSATPGLIGGTYSQLRRLARFVWRSARRRQTRTGFYTAFLSLERSLRRAGCDVRVNDFAEAARRPDYPIGLAGYPSVLAKAPASNPRIFGHGDFGDPQAAARLLQDPRYRMLLAPGAWLAALFAPLCGDRYREWPVAIDPDAWPDMSAHPKHIDVVVYDKIRWRRDEQVPRVLDPAIRHLEARGLSYVVLRYGDHHQGEFRAAVREARAMLFLCEHETQGIAYQEAMAANVPILAWEEGEVVDPNIRAFAPPDHRVSAVPYFDERCGSKFRIGEFAERFDAFWAARETYRPRDYVLDRLSMHRAAHDYLTYYEAAAQGS